MPFVPLVLRMQSLWLARVLTGLLAELAPSVLVMLGVIAAR